MAFQVTIENEAQIGGLSLDQTRKAIKERSDLLSQVFQEAGDNLDPKAVTILEIKDGVDLATRISKMNDELTKLGERASEFESMEAAKAQAERWQKWADANPNDPRRFAPRGDEPAGEPPIKSIGDLFAESELYAHAKGHGGDRSLRIDGWNAKAFLEGKTTMSTSAGWAPQSIRTGVVSLDPQRPVELTSLLPAIPTSQAAVVFMEETTFTNNAAERAENAAYAEGALALTERSKTVRSVGVSLPVTDEQLADVEGIRAYLDSRLTFMVRQRLDSQIINGNNVAPNVEGTLNVSGIQTQAKGADPVPDAIYKAMTLVEVTGRAIPMVCILHPNDWRDIRLLRTADGMYIWGNPSEAGPERIWSLPVVKSSAISEGTGLVADYTRHAALYTRQGLELQTGYVNDDFLDGRVTIRAGLRVAVVHYRPEAFCTVTGI